MTKDSKGRDVGDYSKMTPQQAAEYIKMTFGENAEKAVDGKIKRAEAAVKAADKMKVDYSADEGDAIEAEAKKKAAMEAAQKELTFFTTVKNKMKQTDAKEQAGGGGLTGNRYDQWRKDGYHIGEGGVRYDRQKKEDMTGVYGRDVQVDFTPTVGVKGRAKVVEVDSVQASHVNGQVNPMHFGPDWQPKDRTDAASKLGQDKALTNFDPEKITGDGNAFIGSSPSVNERHEVIQGNNRVEILRRLYDEQPEKAAAYKQWLIDHAAEFGYDPAEIAKMKRPVLVNELPVDDATAKELGQYRASDFESGGKEIPRASVVINRLGEKMQNVANILLNQGSLSDDAKMSDLIAQNANKVLDFLAKEGVLSATEQQTLRKDNTAMRQWMEELLKANLFDGDKETEAAFNQLPDNARRAVLSTYMRDAKSDDAAKIKQDLQHSFEAYVQMMNDPAFANAKNVADARAAVAHEIEKGNESLFGEAPLREKFSNFELELAALYKGLKDQKTLKGLLTKYFDAVQGDKAIGRQLEIGEEPRDAISKDDAIKEVFGLHDSKPAETQRQVDEAVKGLITEITKQVGDDFVETDDKVAQQTIARAEGEQGDVDPVLKDAYYINEAGTDQDEFAKRASKYLYPAAARALAMERDIALDDPVKAQKYLQKYIEETEAGEKTIKPGMIDAWGKIVNAISHREFGGADKPQGNYTKLRFQIKTPEQRKAAENAYKWAVENRPDDRAVYAVVNMDKPNAVPTYFEKKDFATKFARYYGKELGYGNYKLINIEKTFEENVKGLRGVFPEEFEPYKVREMRSDEIDKKYPNWLEGTTNDNGKHTTQVAGTVGTYKKVANWIEKHLGKKIKILDASSGMGLGTQELRNQGFDIEDVEPYQSEDRKKSNPATYSSYNDVKGKYDFIISNAVLNVIPDDWRSNVLHDMASRLNTGGKLFINTRKAGEEKGIKDKIELDSPQEVLVKRHGKIASYQRFFTPKELKEWAEKELGDGYEVEIANEKNSGTNGLAAIVITKKAPEESVSTPKEIGGRDSVDSPKADAKVQQKLDNTKDIYQKSPNKTRGFITDVSRALGLTPHEASQYGSFDLPDGGRVTLRISNHNARISLFDKNGEDNAISIVISRFKNKGALNDGRAHVVEVFYPKKAIENSKGKPLVDIIDSIKEALATGEYKDKTGIGQVREYNTKKRLFRSKDGEVYGFTDGEKIYLDTKKMKPETPLHEYTHLWSDALRRVNPEEWEHVKGLFDKVDGLKEEVKKLYPELEGDDLYDEMIAVFSGREGAKKVEDVVRRLAAEDGKSVTESAKAMGFIERVKTALKTYWKGVADLLHIHFTTAEEVADKVLADWAGGFDPRKVEARKEPKKSQKKSQRRPPRS